MSMAREKDFHFQRTTSDPLLQGHTAQKLHGDEGVVAMFADLVNCADIRMVKSRSRSRLAAETL